MVFHLTVTVNFPDGSERQIDYTGKPLAQCEVKELVMGYLANHASSFVFTVVPCPEVREGQDNPNG